MTTLTKRPATAIISKAAQYVAHKREREAADAKARAEVLRKWERTKVDAMPSEQEIVEWLDPDWRDHFATTEQAAAHYSRWSPVEWVHAVKELMQ